MQEKIDIAIESLIYVYELSVNKKQKALLAKTIRTLQLQAEQLNLQTEEWKYD